MRATRNLRETNIIEQHEIRIMPDTNRQRVRAVCDLHGWQSRWCAVGPGYPYDPVKGWTPPASLIGRAGELGAEHLRSSSR